MKFYSTNDPNHTADLATAIFRGLPADNGLYMPERLDPLPPSFFEALPGMSFPEIGFQVTKHLLGDDVPEEDLKALVYDAINFPAPVVKLDDKRSVLELFHGPSLAFKDFGARFMSRLMGHFNKGNDKQLVILVATSGDTGGAVAAGFYKTPGIEVVILYPKGKVSLLQEKQLTTLGHNIHALEVDGTFDDCQAIVKKASYKQLGAQGDPVAFCIPSGNFGNLTAGLLAQRMKYTPRPSVATLSNAMDVGAPSNFARMLNLYGHVNGLDPLSPATHAKMTELITGYAYDDATTEQAVKEVESKFGYVIDPHGAVGYLALTEWQKANPNTRGVILETAHPSKFKPDVERILGHEIDVPLRLAEMEDREKVATPMGITYAPVKEWLKRKYL